MDKEEFLMSMQRYLANIIISGSTLRNQGAEGVVEATRNFLVNLDLSKLKTIQLSEYPEILNEWTSKLQQELPNDANKWGTARKGINVFMVQVFMNRYLSEEYGMEKFKDILETPLDSYAAKELKRLNSITKLPRWETIKNLTDSPSSEYQKCASQVAQENGLCRANVDIILWRPE